MRGVKRKRLKLGCRKFLMKVVSVLCEQISVIDLNHYRILSTKIVAFEYETHNIYREDGILVNCKSFLVSIKTYKILKNCDNVYLILHW